MWLKKKKPLAKSSTRSKTSKNETNQQKYNYQEVVGNDEDEKSDEDEYEIEKLKTKSRPEKPYKREYILRSSVSRPAPFSRQSPQRMYVLLSRDEFRLAGAFTEDTMFF